MSSKCKQREYQVYYELIYPSRAEDIAVDLTARRTVKRMQIVAIDVGQKFSSVFQQILDCIRKTQDSEMGIAISSYKAA